MRPKATPVKGEKLVEWNKLDHSKFCENAAEFLSLHPSLDGSISPPRKSSKQEMSIVDASEDAQLQAAIRASLEQDTHSSDSDGSESEYDIDLETFTGSEDESVPSPVKRIKTSEKKPHGKSNLLSKLQKLSESRNKSKRMPFTQSSSSSATIYKSLTSLKSPIFSSSQTTELPCSSKQSTATTVPVKEDTTPSWKKYIGSKDDPVSNLMIRFPDGNRQQLSLPCTSQMFALEEYIREKGYPNEKYELITNFPRRKLSTYDKDLSLKDAGLFPQDTVFVQER